MDTIGLLAAWAGMLSFLLVTLITVATNLTTSPLQRWWAKTSPVRAGRRIQALRAEISASEIPSTAYVADLTCLYGTMILNLIAGATVVILSILVLDLGPSLLAAMLPFNIDSKFLTRATGLFLFAMSYVFVFRLSYLAVRIRKQTRSHTPGFARRAMQEIEDLAPKTDRQQEPANAKHY